MAEKEHVEKIKDSKFNRQRAETATLRSNCTSGFIFTLGGTARLQSAFHHIIAISSIQDGNIKPADSLDFFHDCMAVTPWDTNDGPNLIGLPLKSVYGNADRYSLTSILETIHSQLPGMANVDAGLGVFGSVPDLPCHQVEHDDYNTEQVIDICKNVWKPLARVRKNCAVDGTSIQGQLESSSVAWRQFLTARGKECGGAAHCWRNRNEPGFDSFWYIPFSMNPGNPRKTIPPPDLASRSGSIKAWLKACFTMIR
jgi:hypothetical protein